MSIDFAPIYAAQMTVFGETLDYTVSGEESSSEFVGVWHEDYFSSDLYETKKVLTRVFTTQTKLDVNGITVAVGDTITKNSVDYTIVESYTDKDNGYVITLSKEY